MISHNKLWYHGTYSELDFAPTSLCASAQKGAKSAKVHEVIPSSADDYTTRFGFRTRSLLHHLGSPSGRRLKHRRYLYILVQYQDLHRISELNTVLLSTSSTSTVTCQSQKREDERTDRINDLRLQA